MSIVSETADKLKERIAAQGQVSVEEAKEFAIGEGVPPTQWGLVIGTGQGKGRNWWHQSDGMLINGPKPSTNGSAASAPIVDPLTLETPVDQFINVAMQLGIPETTAKAVAFYIDNNFQLMDPNKVADGLSQITEINPAQKARLLMTWTSFTQGEVTPELVKKARDLGRSPLAATVAEPSSNGHAPDRRFVAMHGQVLPCVPDDAGAMTLGEAIQVANLQFQSKEPKENNDTAFVAMMQEQGLTARATMELLARDNNPPAPAAPADHTELMLKFMEARMDAERERSNGQMELMAQTHNSQMDKLTEVMGQIAANMNQKKSMFGDLDDMIPGMGQKLIEKLLGSDEQSAGGLKISLPGLNGNSEQSAEVSLDVYERIKGMEQKDAMIAMAKTQFPALLQTAERMAKAINIAVKAEKEGEAEAEDQMEEMNCVNCSMLMTFRVGAGAIQCPNTECGAVQTPDGQWLNKPVPTPAVAADPEPAPDNEEGPAMADLSAGDEIPPDEAQEAVTADEKEKEPVPA